MIHIYNFTICLNYEALKSNALICGNLLNLDRYIECIQIIKMRRIVLKSYGQEGVACFQSKYIA